MSRPADLAPTLSIPVEVPVEGFAGRKLACRRGERLIFRGLDFTLPRGGALVLLGPNGSGKSSLLRLMAGLTPPFAGQLFWDGAALVDAAEPHRTHLHFIGHAEALKPVLSATETLGFWAAMRGGSDEKVAAALERFGLAAIADLPCRYLSAGQKRRLALARLVASPAPLWLLDEPTTALDSDGIAQLSAAIAAHRRGGGSVVVSTHLALDLADAQSLSLAEFRARPIDPEDVA
jgi:heme exporter protein A